MTFGSSQEVRSLHMLSGTIYFLASVKITSVSSMNVVGIVGVNPTSGAISTFEILTASDTTNEDPIGSFKLSETELFILWSSDTSTKDHAVAIYNVSTKSASQIYEYNGSFNLRKWGESFMI